MLTSFSLYALRERYPSNDAAVAAGTHPRRGREARLGHDFGPDIAAQSIAGTGDRTKKVGITRLHSDNDQAARESVIRGIEQALGAEDARAAWEEGRAGPPNLTDDALDSLFRDR